MKAGFILLLGYASAMMSAIFMPNYSQALGASSFEVGVIGTAYGAALLISSYLFGRASDLRGRRGFVLLGLALAAVAHAAQILAFNATSLMLIRAFAGFAMGIFTPPLIAYTYDSGEKLGNLAAFGSLGWALGSLFAGVVAGAGELYFAEQLMPYWLVFALCSLLFLISLRIALTLPEVSAPSMEVPLLPLDLIRRNYHIYLPNLLRHTGAFAVWIIFPLYLAQLGASKFWIGIIYFLNAFAQFFIMRRLNFASPARLVELGLALSMVVFLSYALVESYPLVLPIQLFLALSYSLLYVGSLRYLTENNPEKATSVGLLGSFMSISMALGPMLGGTISHAYGYEASMYFASGITLLALLINLSRRFSSG
ncbi:MFS transporter [Candidatus Pyrohabitans sp.]